MGLSLFMHKLLTTAERPITMASFEGRFVLFFSTCVMICSASLSSKTLGSSDYKAIRIITIDTLRSKNAFGGGLLWVPGETDRSYSVDTLS